MSPAPRRLAHSVRGHLQAQCMEVLRLASQKSVGFSIADPDFCQLHVAIYELYLLGYITRTSSGFEDWAITEAGRDEVSAWEAAPVPKRVNPT